VRPDLVDPASLPVAGRSPASGPSLRAITWAFVLGGIALRLRQYLFDRSLWNDESELVLNILHRSPAGLLKRLDDYQAAPIGFLWSEKLAVHFLGTGEMALRVVPFVAGACSLFLFLLVARRFLSRGAVPLALALFALCGPLIYYASEVKPYASDVAVALLIYLSTDILFESEITARGLVAAALVGALAVWFSFTALFVLAGVGLALLCAAIGRRGRWPLFSVAVVGFFWAVSFVIFYVSFLRTASNNPELIEYWRSAYAPLPPKSVFDVLWYKVYLLNMFSNPAGLTFTGIGAVAAVMGAIGFVRRDRNRFLALFLPFAVTLLASALHRYPFQGRLLLFLAPALLFLVAEGLYAISRITRSAGPSFAGLLIAFLFLDPVITAARQFIRPVGVEEARSAIGYVEQHRAPDDILYCYYSASFPLAYYRERGVLGSMNEVIGVDSRDNLALYRADLDKLRGQKRVWILFSHDWQSSGIDEQAYFLDYLDQIGKRLDGMQATGAAAYLYDLSGTGPNAK
jgi:hypothetical protein